MVSSVVGHVWQAIQRRKYRLLLLMIVASLVFQPLVAGNLGGRVAHELALGLGMLASFVVFESTRERLVGLTLALPAMTGNLARYVMHAEYESDMLALNQACTGLFLVFAIYVILRSLFRQRTVQSEHLVGVFCGYLLAGLLWSNLYMLTEQYRPGSFVIPESENWEMQDPDRRRSLFNYFSFSTLTTVGYGDITPQRPLACTLAWLEAAFGQFYVAVLMAQLVGLKLAQPREVSPQA